MIVLSVLSWRVKFASISTSSSLSFGLLCSLLYFVFVFTYFFFFLSHALNKCNKKKTIYSSNVLNRVIEVELNQNATPGQSMIVTENESEDDDNDVVAVGLLMATNKRFDKFLIQQT